jgi:hypothetical protein
LSGVQPEDLNGEDGQGGDEAGQQAVEKLEPLVQEAGFKTDKIVLGEDTDPGELTQEYVNSIKDWINEKDLHN